MEVEASSGALHMNVENEESNEEQLEITIVPDNPLTTQNPSIHTLKNDLDIWTWPSICMDLT